MQGVITIEWAMGADPEDFESYSWSVRPDPPVADELVAGILADILAVY